jgi:hypothetical protein
LRSTLCGSTNSPSTWKESTPIPLNTLTRNITILLAAATLANSQEKLNSASLESEPVTPTTARIIGDIPDGTPSQEEPTRPEFVVPAQDILYKKTYQQGGRSITFQRITPIALPLPPPTINEAAEIPNTPLQTQTTAASEKGSAEEFIMASATVFHLKNSQALSLVEIRSPESGQSVQFWSSADFGLVSGIFAFIGTDGKTRSLMLLWSASEVKSLADLKSELGLESPEIPEFAYGEATYVINPASKPSSAAIIAIQSLHDIYNREYARLNAAYKRREQDRLISEAKLKAHPPQSDNIILNYWRTEKPAADTKGAAQ